jgi:hypothetical protein
MRRTLLLAAAVIAALTAVPSGAAFAQSRRGSDADKRQEEESSKKRKRDEEWGDNQAPLPALRNAGPCPFVKTLYDAGRFVEFVEGREASANVAFSGEIQSISAGCAYKDAEPIKVQLDILFALGRGPKATASSKTFRYWVAVTKRNQEVLAKQYFDLPVTFAAGEDRLYATETIDQIVIPRATISTSGSNFEVLIGFDVTPEQAAFNRDGKRFRVNAGEAGATSANP